jgi:hypothetical protein
MSKNDDEVNEFTDEVTDGTYNLPCVEVIFKFVKQNRCLLWNDEAKANIKPIYECRCNGRLQTKRSTRLSHTGLVQPRQTFMETVLIFFI